jgi:hypothetical protein
LRFVRVSWLGEWSFRIHLAKGSMLTDVGASALRDPSPHWTRQPPSPRSNNRVRDKLRSFTIGLPLNLRLDQRTAIPHSESSSSTLLVTNSMASTTKLTMPLAHGPAGNRPKGTAVRACQMIVLLVVQIGDDDDTKRARG